VLAWYWGVAALLLAGFLSLFPYVNLRQGYAINGFREQHTGGPFLCVYPSIIFCVRLVLLLF
jgi:hypothetical protein